MDHASAPVEYSPTEQKSFVEIDVPIDDTPSEIDGPSAPVEYRPAEQKSFVEIEGPIDDTPSEIDDTPIDDTSSEEDPDHWHDSSQSFLPKVPANQRNENPEAFQPHLFFFGPYHYIASLASNPRLATTTIDDGEHLKRQVVKALLEEGQLKELAHKIESHYSDIKEMYSHVALQHWETISKEELSQRMAVDAVTVAAAFYISSWCIYASFGLQQGPYPCSLLAYFSPPMVAMLFDDVLLVENQLPFNVLRYAVKTLKLSSFCSSITLQTMVKDYCATGQDYFPDHIFQWPNRRTSVSSDCLLGAIYDCLTPIPQDDKDAESQYNEWHAIESDYRLLTASHLARCGIRCRMLKKQPPAKSLPSKQQSPKSTPYNGNKLRSACFINFTKEEKPPELGPASYGAAPFMSSITFNEKEKVIELPRIFVGESTVRFLHNLLAYEACCRYPKQRCVVSYVTFMDRLIDTEEDVKILVKAGVIDNLFGSDEDLATAWNKLGKFVMACWTLQDYQILLKVNKLAKSRVRQWRAGFLETYWEKKPWLMVSIAVAVVLLVATVLQTVFTIQSAMKGSN